MLWHVVNVSRTTLFQEGVFEGGFAKCPGNQTQSATCMCAVSTSFLVGSYNGKIWLCSSHTIVTWSKFD